MPKINPNAEVVIYQSKSGAIELKNDVKAETIWATQAQIVSLFDVDQSVVSRHVDGIFADGELSKKSNMQKMHIANSDKQVNLYSLDIILAVGYRTNSTKAIAFRKWATNTLRQHIVEGYTIDKKRTGNNYDAFLKAVDDVKRLLPSGVPVDTASVLELIKTFASTWVSLDAYDKSSLPQHGLTKKQVLINADELETAIAEFKKELLAKNAIDLFGNPRSLRVVAGLVGNVFQTDEAIDLFGNPRSLRVVAGLVGNVFQTFGGKDLYPTIEEKAAHLLYFMVKNHPFTDGNKRSGAFSFVWFLKRAGILDIAKMTPEALTALTLLVAESAPSEKNRIIGLVLMLINRR